MSQVYTLKVAIDDSKIREIEKRLMNVVNGGQQGAGLKSAGTGQQGAGMAKNIGKLAMIATGVLALVGMVSKLMQMTVNASPMLQQMLKLLNFGIMLILRPIGDFFGFFLKPIMIIFLRNIALPWFRLARPIMQKLGTWLGNQVVKDPIKAVAPLAGIVGMLIANRDTIITQITGHFAMWEFAIKKWVGDFHLPNIGELALGLKTWVTEQVDGLPNFAGRISAFIRRWVNRLSRQLPSWDAITLGFNKWVELNIGQLPSWDDLINTLSTVKTTILGIAESIKQFFVDLASLLGIGVEKSSPAPSPTSGETRPIFELPDFNNIGSDVEDAWIEFTDRLQGK